MRPGAFGLMFDAPSPLVFDPSAVGPDGIACLVVSGPLEHRASWWCSYEDIGAQVQAALAHSAVRALVLKIDSPGGVVAGMGQAHRAIREMRKASGKPIVAWVDELAASAAYNIASACDEIWMPPEAAVGSIGIITCAIDESAKLEKEGVAVRYFVTGRRKADGQPGAPMTDEVAQVIQSKVDALGEAFFATIGRARGMKPAAVRALEAAVFMGTAAVEAGLADGVSDWPAFLGTLRDTLGATVGTPRGTAGTTAARKKDPAMALTKMQAAAQKTAADLLLQTAQAAYEKKPTAETLAAMISAQGEHAKIVHHLKHEEKTVETDDSERPGMPDTARSGPAAAAEGDEEEPASSEEVETAKKASKAKGGARGMSRAEGEEDEEKAHAAAFASADRRYIGRARAAGVDAWGTRGPLALFKACQAASGEETIEGVFGFLRALPEKLKATSTIAVDVEKLKAKDRENEIAAIVASAKAAGKTRGKEHRAELRKLGAVEGPRFLRAVIKNLPALGRSEAFGAREGDDGRGQFQGGDAQAEAVIAEALKGLPAEHHALYRENFAKNLAASGKTKIPAA